MLGFGIREKTTSIGTGNLTLSAEAGYPRFSSVFATSVPFYYSILDASNKPLEHGIGYLSDANTLVREKIIATFVSGVYDDLAPTPVDLASGDKFVICTHGQASALVGMPGLNALNLTTKGVLAYNQTWSISTGDVGNGNVLIVWPFRLEAGFECDAAGIRMSAAETGKTAKFALYTCTKDGWAGKKLRECSFTVEVGNRYSTWMEGNIFLAPGWYFGAWTTDATAAVGQFVRQINSSARGQSSTPMALASDASNTSFARPWSYASKAITTPLTFPDPMENITAFTLQPITASVHIPAVVLRAI